MTVMKEFQFPVSVRWRGGSLTRASAPEKTDLEVATPPEFHNGVPGVWSPEELLVASVGTCFTITLASVAARLGAPLVDADVRATGHMSKRNDGRLGFTAIEIDASLEATPDGVAAVESIVPLAEERCLIAMALDVPVQVAATVRPVAVEAVAPA